MKVGIICSPVPGHMTPMCAFANALKEKNHEVVFFNVEDVRDFIENTGNRLVTVGKEKFPKGSWIKHMQPMSKQSGLAVIFGTIRLNTLLARIYCEDIPKIAIDEKIDLFLIDQIQFQGALIAEKVGVPFVTIACALRLNRDPSPFYPPPFVPWYGKTPLHVVLNWIAFKVYSFFTAPILKEANTFARKNGLRKLTNTDDSFSKVLEIYQIPLEFDFESGIDKTNRYHVGPFVRKSVSSIPFDYSKLDSRPLIYAALGTLQNGVDEIFKNIIRACGELPEYQAVISLGKPEGEINFAKFGPLPENVILVPYAPQSELVERSSLVITHAGLNTVLDSLASGIPMVAIPIANDQPATAARIINSKTGVVLSPRNATADRIKAAILSVRDGKEFRMNALKMKQNISQAGGMPRAIELITHAMEKCV